MPAEANVRRCPICGRLGAFTAPTHPPRPFCSVRCQQVDLGRWLTDSYVIPGDDLVDSAETDGYPAPPAGGGVPRAGGDGPR